MSGISQKKGRPPLDRGSTAVCIPVNAEPDLLHRCLRSVQAHTPSDVPVLVVEEADRDPEVERFLSQLDRELHHIRLTDSPGPISLANAALDACGEADAVLLSSHAVVFDGWFERLRDAGRSDTTVGTASALGNNAGLLSVGEPHEPLPANASLERLSLEIAQRSPRARPRTPAADGHCIWISRSALELAGPLDTAFASLRAAVIDFSQRSLLQGLVNVAADDVFVASVMPGLSAHGGPLAIGDDRPLLVRRYPYLPGALEAGTPLLPLLRSTSVARSLLRRLSVTIDARIVRGSFSGAQAETLELIEMLDSSDAADVRVLLDPAINRDALAVLDRMPRVQRLYIGDVGPDVERTAVVHRPYQVSSVGDLELLPQLGERIVITHLDLIAFHNPGYFASFEGWQQYRRVTRQSLAMADRVIFLSEHAVNDAIREGVVDRDRTLVMPMAVNRRPATVPEARRPREAPDGRFLLCIGNDFRHKNRLFALKLLTELRALGWDGRLVLAGTHVEHGSSRGDEAAYIAVHPELADAVVELPAVAEAEKQWLYARAAAVVYATTYEGFGLIPFEAARAGTLCLYAPQASLAETLPPEAAAIVQWDAVASAENALALLRDEAERRRHVELVSEAAARMEDWDSFQSMLLEVYEQAARAPFREAAALAAEAQIREGELARWIGLEENMGALVGPDAYLPQDVQRALLAVATRKRLRRPLFALLRLLYRIGYRARQR
jgi:glycosyltransferase involved in cell wall biosynthesis